ncbi:MAG: dihydrolipoamide acetyltransferase family protein [Spirochaetia bacterium]
MAIEIKMPPLSQTTDTVTLTEWLVEVGDTITKGQSIAGVETDKVTMEVESFTGGTVLKFLYTPGDEVPVGDVIALIGEPEEDVSDYGGTLDGETAEKPAEKTAASEGAEARSKKSAPAAERVSGSEAEADVKATPLVYNFARKRNVDLSRVTGTGPQGLIVKEDVVRYLESGSGAAEGPAAAGVRAAGRTAEAEAVPAGAAYTDRELGRNQRIVAGNLSRSAAEIPAYTVTSTVYTNDLTAAGKSYPADKKPPMYSFYIHAAARALKEHSGINGCFTNGSHRVYKNINIGFAVAHAGDLFVPVVKDADAKSLEQIAGEVRWLTAKVTNGRLEAEDISGCTFTVSNLGVFPVDEFTAIITPGQAAVLAVGRSEKRMVIDDQDRMTIKECARVTGSFDHRIVNGAEAAAFLSTVKEALESIRS